MSCDHKFVDSNRCLKCGWTSPQRKRGFLMLTKEQIAQASELSAAIWRALTDKRQENGAADFDVASLAVLCVLGRMHGHCGPAEWSARDCWEFILENDERTFETFARVYDEARRRRGA